MNEQISATRLKLENELANATDLKQLEDMRITYLGKKGSITDLLKNMKNLSSEEKKTFGQEVNALKNEATEKIAQKIKEFKDAAILKELSAMPEFDLSIPVNSDRGSYHPITLVQRECERIFKSDMVSFKKRRVVF